MMVAAAAGLHASQYRMHAISEPHHVDVEHLLPLRLGSCVGLSQQHDAGIVDKTSHRAELVPPACATAALLWRRCR